jgi:hypothetical protein
MGDVDDRGLSSMTTAARLRFAIRAYAALDMAPAEILTAVNDVLCGLPVDHTANAVVARIDPTGRELRWAAAGQVAPVRFDASGRGSVLSGPLGLALGEVPEVRYSDAAVPLDAGDRVLLYTGGTGRSERRRGGGLDLVRRAGEHVDLANFEALVEHVITAIAVPDDEDICALILHVTPPPR